jgi:Na+/pantothenate symporter
MRAPHIVLATIVILVGLTGALNRLVTPDFEPHDAVIYGLQIALPDGVTTFPAELVPLP